MELLKQQVISRQHEYKVLYFHAELFSGPLHTILERGDGNKDGTVGKPFWGVKTKLLNVDPVTKEGEVALYTRNTFMGYVKV